MTVLELRKALEPFSPGAQVVLGGAVFYEIEKVGRADSEDARIFLRVVLQEGDAILVFDE